MILTRDASLSEALWDAYVERITPFLHLFPSSVTELTGVAGGGTAAVVQMVEYVDIGATRHYLKAEMTCVAPFTNRTVLLGITTGAEPGYNLRGQRSHVSDPLNLWQVS